MSEAAQQPQNRTEPPPHSHEVTDDSIFKVVSDLLQLHVFSASDDDDGMNEPLWLMSSVYTRV